MRKEVAVFLLVLSSLCPDEISCATFGVANSRHALLPGNLERSKNIKCLSSRGSSVLLELRGGDKNNYYGGGDDRDYRYDDRRRSGDYGYQGEEKGRNDYYSGYDERRPSSREYHEDRYSDDRYGE